MRIVSWNCRQGFNQKAAAFLELRPDIGVVPESCEFPDIAHAGLFERAVPHLWTGAIPQKGLGVFAPGAHSLTQVAPVRIIQEKHGLACKWAGAEVEAGMVGIWTVPGQGAGDRYLAAAKGIVDAYANFLGTGTTLMAGDFNVSGKTAGQELPLFVGELEARFGLVSAYHAFFGIQIGAEPTGTLWWRGHEQESFHCDFVFVPKTWKIVRVEIGGYAQWGSAQATARSDHAPLVVEVIPARTA